MLPYSTIAVNMKLFGTYHRLFHTFTSLRALILVVSFVPNQIQLNLIYTHTYGATICMRHRPRTHSLNYSFGTEVSVLTFLIRFEILMLYTHYIQQQRQQQ